MAQEQRFDQIPAQTPVPTVNLRANLERGQDGRRRGIFCQVALTVAFPNAPESVLDYWPDADWDDLPPLKGRVAKIWCGKLPIKPVPAMFVQFRDYTFPEIRKNPALNAAFEPCFSHHNQRAYISNLDGDGLLIVHFCSAVLPKLTQQLQALPWVIAVHRADAKLAFTEEQMAQILPFRR